VKGAIEDLGTSASGIGSCGKVSSVPAMANAALPCGKRNSVASRAIAHAASAANGRRQRKASPSLYARSSISQTRPRASFSLSATVMLM
jgi:hypothetical protein